MIRVLLVDDSAVVRRLVTNALNRDPGLEVVDTAANGQIALSRLQEIGPDVVVLDLEMPVMDGLQTLVELRKTHPCLPVIMFSRFTQRGVEATVHALTLGADDYVPKPGDGLDVDACIGEHLIPKIKLLAQRRSLSSEPSAPVDSKLQRPFESVVAKAQRKPIEVIVIAASTGGPNALAELVPAFQQNCPVPILVVQHMPAEFTTRLAERLDEKSQLKVREAAHGEPVSAGQVWIAAGGHHLTLRLDSGRVSLALNQDPPVNSCRPSADVLFQSAAEAYGAGVLAVVLTGLGQDGLVGCERVRAAGGQVIVQDEATSVVWSMPGAVAQAGLADLVLPLNQLASETMSRVRRRKE